MKTNPFLFENLNYRDSSCLFALFSLNLSQVAPPTQYDTKLTRKNINQNPIVRMVKKSKKPKYCENSNMFSGILNVATNVTVNFFFGNKNTNQFS